MSVCLWAVLQAGKACIIVSSAQCWCFHMLMTFQGFLPRFQFLWCCTKDFALLILCNAVHFPHEHTIQIQARVHLEPMAYCMLIFFCVLYIYLVQAKGLGEGKAPALLEGSADHGCAGCGWSAGQPKRVRKLNPAHLHTDVHCIDGAVEQRQFGSGAYCVTMKGLQRQHTRINTYLLCLHWHHKYK